MELEELKTAWETMNQQLKRDSAINLAMYTHQKLESTRSNLRPLFWGQMLQVLFGVSFLLLAAALWSSRPGAISVIVAGVLVNASVPKPTMLVVADNAIAWKLAASWAKTLSVPPPARRACWAMLTTKIP